MFKVAGTMFALSQFAEHPLRVSLKCEPQLAEQLRATYSAVIPGYHLNKFVTGLYPLLCRLCLAWTAGVRARLFWTRSRC